MKPSEHPEFFRLPPPEGRSRESTIVLSRQGRFFHDGQPVLHPGMHRAFASWLTRHPDDGRYVLNNGYDWSYLNVEGPARFVQAVRDTDGILRLELLDGTEHTLRPEMLRVDADGNLSVILPEGEPAAFTPAAQLQLGPWLVERDGVVGLQLGVFFSRIQTA